MYLAIENFAIALWLVQSKLAIFSTNQMQNYIAHELVIRVFLHFRQFPCLGCHWLFQKFFVGLIGCCDYLVFVIRNSIEMHFIGIFWYYYLPEVKSQKSKRSERCLANIGSKFLNCGAALVEGITRYFDFINWVDNVNWSLKRDSEPKFICF